MCIRDSSNKNELADGGVELIRGPMGVMNTQRISTFIAGFVLVLIALVVIFNLVNSRTGRAVMAARDNRIAAESVGISVTKYKMIAFVVSAALAGAAGTLYGCSQTTFAATKFDFNTSILILVFVVLEMCIRDRCNPLRNCGAITKISGLPRGAGGRAK